MDDLSSTPQARSAVSTFFMRLGQRYQSLLGKLWVKSVIRKKRVICVSVKGKIQWRIFLNFIIKNHPHMFRFPFTDKSTPHTKVRWLIAFLNIGLFFMRILIAQGWYIVTYALGIYHLNLFIAFLTPKIDPAFDLDSGELTTTTFT